MKRKLDASVETSGPHDFAVRVSTVRQRCLRVHRIPCPTSVTIAIRPSCGTGWRAYNFDLGEAGTVLFLQMGLDSPNHIDPVKQIRPCAQESHTRERVSSTLRTLMIEPRGLGIPDHPPWRMMTISCAAWCATSHHRLDARQRGDKFAKPSASDFEVAVLVERRAGRREQHYRIGKSRCFRLARRIGNRDLERFRDLVRHGIAERARKFLGRFPDQISLADARKVFAQACDAAELRLAARDPENLGEGRQRMRRRIRIGPLGSLAKRNFPRLTTRFIRMASSGKLGNPVCRVSSDSPSAKAQAEAQAAFWALCKPRNDPIPPIRATSVRAPPEARQMVSRST